MGACARSASQISELNVNQTGTLKPKIMADSTPLKGSVLDRMHRTQQAIKLLSEIYEEIGPGEMGSEEKNDIEMSINTLHWYYNRMSNQNTQHVVGNFSDAFKKTDDDEAPH